MKKTMITTLSLLVCSSLLAVTLYAAPSTEASPQGQGSEIHNCKVEENQFSFRLVEGEQGQVLELVVKDAEGNIIDGAKVLFTVVAPDERQDQILAEQQGEGYAAQVALDAPGAYEISAQVASAEKVLEDKFTYQVAAK